LAGKKLPPQFEGVLNVIRSAIVPSDSDPDRDFLESFDCISPDVIDAVLADPANRFLPIEQ
jgi:hypothetical protein